MKEKCVNLGMTYTTVSPLTVVRFMVEPGVPPNAGLLFSGVMFIIAKDRENNRG